MITPFERYVVSSLSLALMRQGFTVNSEPLLSGKPSLRFDLLATKSDDQKSIGIEIKTFNRKISDSPKLVKPKRTSFQSSPLSVHTVFVSSEPKRVYIDQELAEIVHMKDHFVSVLRGAV